MYIIAYLNGDFFRLQAVTEKEIEKVKQAMLQDNENLTFEILTREQYLEWENNQPKPPQEPTQDDYLIDLDFRLSMLELGI